MKDNLIWEEKNLTEPLTKSENNGGLEENDTTPLIKMPSNNTKKINTTNQNKINNCKFCNKEFVPDKFHPNQLFCNADCGQKNRWHGNKHIIKKICKGCNIEFVCNNFAYKQQIYCSVDCQGKHHRRKNEVKDRRKRRHNERMETEPSYKLSYCLRIRLNKALKGNYKSGSAVRDLGCSIDELKTYIESQFQQGMTWNNHGEWHIDHKKPLDMFDLTDRKQLLEACHYTNLQPLWAKDNIRKSNKLS